MSDNKQQIERDAARYRPWFREDGTKYYPSHFINVNGTGFNGIEHLDDLIDQAMKLYP